MYEKSYLVPLASGASDQHGFVTPLWIWLWLCYTTLIHLLALACNTEEKSTPLKPTALLPQCLAPAECRPSAVQCECNSLQPKK